MAKQQRSGSEAFLFVSNCNMLWFLGLVLASIESCRTEWCGVNGERTEIPVEIEVPSFDVPEFDNYALLLEKDVD